MQLQLSSTANRRSPTHVLRLWLREEDNPVIGDWRSATGDRRPAIGDRRSATGDRRLATGERPAAGGNQGLAGNGDRRAATGDRLLVARHSLLCCSLLAVFYRFYLGSKPENAPAR